MLRELLLELRMTFSMAKKNNMIDMVPHIRVPDKSPPRDRFLSREEAAQLMEAAQTAHLKLFIHMALATGARKGALLGPTWDRVNWETRRIDFNDPLKTITKKRRSTVPITVQTASLLKEAQTYAETDYVIEYMGKPLQDMKRTFNSAVAKAGLKKVKPHVLKHTAISWLSQGSHSIEKISEITATHPNTVKRIYRKFAPEFLQDEAEYLGKYLDFADLAAKKQQAQQEHVA